MSKALVMDTNALISAALITGSVAITANASCIITGDKALLELQPFREIPILNASDFLLQF